ncbi:MAG TPA: hypothetical protein VE673_14895 [Pseudonocardiaceae bacterium]|nr:hypothetical protein [Pseudonocardiaceae bacterium]
MTFAVPAEGECVAAAIAVEQDYVNLLYRHLAESRQHTVARSTPSLAVRQAVDHRDGTVGNMVNRWLGGG